MLDTLMNVWERKKFAVEKAKKCRKTKSMNGFEDFSYVFKRLVSLSAVLMMAFWLSACSDSGESYCFGPDCPGSVTPGDGEISEDVESDGETSDQTGGDGVAHFRAISDYFEINTGNGWEPFFPVGVNVATGTPGRFPSEMDLSRETFDRWLEMVAELNCNMIRTYTLHFPVFYEAFAEYNATHPEHPLYLVQGIWLDELEEGDYMSDATDQIDGEIERVIDALHGMADIEHRFGKSYGTYTTDVSDYLMAWLPGHEMAGYQVEESNEVWAPYTRYEGYYISKDDGLPIEAWVARNLDHVVAYEIAMYGQQRPVAWSNWPALDPIHHPTETPNFDQDTVDVNFEDFTLSESFTSGVYASFHIYPFNPEFIIYDPDYIQVRDSKGKTNSYLGYLLDLKSHLQGIPVFVTEYGLPSSMGYAHVGEYAYNHGGYSELEQAEYVVDLFDSIVESGCGGAVVFELIDEWFKRSWMTNPTMLPNERGRFWYDVINPEESFGLVSYYPIPGQSIAVDGDRSDWEDIGSKVGSQEGEALAPHADGKDDGRTIEAVYMASDPAFLYLMIETASDHFPDLENTVWYVGISTADGATGNTRFPDIDLGVDAAHGMEAMIRLDAAQNTYELLIDSIYDPSPKLNGFAREGSVPGVPVSSDTGDFVLAKYIVNNDAQYITNGYDFVPEKKWYYPGVLTRGDASKNSMAHLQPGLDGVIEIRIPWHIMWVSDPSSHQVLFDDTETDGFESKATSGISVVVVSAVRDGEDVEIVDILPRPSSLTSNLDAASIPFYTWDDWNEIESEERKKPVFYSIQEAYGEYR